MSKRWLARLQCRALSLLLVSVFSFLPILLQAATLSGVVKDQGGQAVEGASVSLFHVQNGRFTQIGNAIKVGSDGAYAWTVSNGSYVLRSNFNGSDVSLAGAPHRAVIATADFTVNGDLVRDTVYDFLLLSGKVVDSNKAPIANVDVQTNMSWHGPEKGAQQELSHRSLAHSNGSVRTDANGQYQMLLFSSDICIASGFYTDNSNCLYDISFTAPTSSGFANAVRNDFAMNRSQTLDQTLTIVDQVKPKIIAGPYLKKVTDNSAEIEWQTDEPANNSVQIVGGARFTQSPLRTNHSVLLRELNAASAYQVQITNTDKQGNVSTTVSLDFTTAGSFNDELAPQFVQAPRVTSLKETQMTLSFCANEPVTGKLVIDETDYVLEDAGRCHELAVSDLLPNQRYRVFAEISDLLGNGPTLSQPSYVKTLSAADLTPPLIISGPAISDVSDVSAVVRWTTNEPASSSVSFNDGTRYRVQNDAALVTDHAVQITGLTASTAYQLMVVSSDGSGNVSNPSSVARFTTKTAPDAIAPLLIGRALVSDIASTSAVISWQTDESASSVIYLGKSSGNLNRVETAPGFNTKHQLSVTQLDPVTTYYFKVESSDLAGNKTNASVLSFTTLAADVAADLEILSQPLIEKLTGNSITLSWRTNLNANSRLVCQSNSGVSEVNKIDFTKNHLLTLIGLDFNTAYRCVAYSSDIQGQIVSRVVGAFTTGEIDSTAPNCSAPATVQGLIQFAELTWQSDELATALVNYRQKGTEDWRQTQPSTLSTNGVLRLNGLSANTVYEYQVTLTDVVGNSAQCSLGEFNSGSETNPPVVPAPAFSVQPFVTDIQQTSATINWSTVSASNGQVRFGLSEGALTKLESVPDFKLSHALVLSQLQPDTVYYLQVDAFNSAGTKTTSATLTFTTSPIPAVETTPPKLISGPVVRHITDRSAVVEWETDKAGSSKVVVAGGATFTDSRLSTSHSVPLTGLTPDTAYNTTVTSTDAKGLVSSPLPANFRTLAIPDTRLPRFVMGPLAHSIDYDKFTIFFCADEPVTGVLNVLPEGALEQESFSLTTGAICHQFVVSNRTARTKHTVNVAITDLAGNGPVNSAPLTVTTLFNLDITPPILTGPVVTDITQTTAIVRWTTNEAANSGVTYSDGRSANKLKNDDFVTSHVMVLTGLTASTKYSLIAYSSDAAGNGPSISAPVEFTTLALPDTKAPLIISGPFVENITSESADIVWTTNESSSHKVSFGLSAETLDTTVNPTGLSTQHRVPLSQLQADTRYYFKVESADLAGNTVISEIASFKTLKPEVVPPTLRITAGPDVESATTNSLTVSWETNLDADSRLVCEAEQSSSAQMSSAHTTQLAPYYTAAASQVIENQYIVLFKDPESPVTLSALADNSLSTSASVANFYGLSKKQSLAQRKVSVNAMALDMERKVRGRVLRQYASKTPGMLMKMKASEVHSLRQDPRVLLIEQDQVMSINAVQSNATWGLDRIDQASLPLNNSYTYDLNGTGVNAYIIDTGILISHSDFGGRAVHGWDFIDNDANASDCNGHGTHVAGTVGSSTWGVAKNVKLYGVRVLDCNGGGTSAGVLAGVDWVTANAKFPAVANMSLGGGNSAALDAAVNRAIDAGITVAVAAGNSNINACSGSPNKVPAAITVASSTSSDSRSSFSNWGSCVDIFAPGSDITSTWHTGGSHMISGTSMAAPHVAGAIALYLQAHPNATPAQVDAALKGFASQGKIRSLNGSPNLLLNTEFDAQTEQPTPPPAPPVEKITFEVSDPNFTTFHQLTLNGLSPSTIYACEVFSKDRAGKQVSATLRGTTESIPDTTAPECLGEAAATAYVDSAQLYWASNELTTAVVNYRPVNTEDWLQNGTLKLAKTDSLMLTGLLAETEYEHQITLSDAAGNQTQCPSGRFTTIAPEAIPAPGFQLQPVVSNITEHSATVSWTTPNPSSGLVRYGKSASNLTAQRSVTELKTEHSVTLQNLNANTLYYLRVDAFNLLGAKTTSDLVNFTTLHVDRDFDRDGVLNEIDNCPLIANPDQADSDNDGAGDVCDPPEVIDNDSDKDGVPNDSDNCPVTANPDQKDTDNNGIGDACDIPVVTIPDFDEDGVPDTSDNCPTVANPDQADSDSNGIGDACDASPNPNNDHDNDGILDNVDNCPQIANPDQTDSNNNGIGDACDAPIVIENDYDKDGIADTNDNCPRIYNPDQADRDNNGIGDVCDVPVVTDDDYDDDGILDRDDNCPLIPNPDQADSNNNGVGDVCDIPDVIENDYDRDGILDGVDNCPLVPNPDQADRDSNGIGDACDVPEVITPPVEKPVGIKLSGIVNGRGVPVAGADVAIYSQQKQFLRVVTTTETGGYLFENMRAGDYFIGVTPPENSGFGSTLLQAIKVADRDVVHLITLIDDAITLSGFLKDSQGRVIDNVQISLHQQNTGNQVGNSVRTNEYGFFKFSVAPGTYKLRPLIDVFNPAVLQAQQTPIMPEYPVPDYAVVLHGPQQIEVSEDTSLEVNLPFALLSGRTLDSQGNPVAGVGLVVRHRFSTTSQDYYLENYATHSLSNAVSDANGEFEFALFTDQSVDILLTPPASRTDLAVTTIPAYQLFADSSEDFTLVEGVALTGRLLDTQGRAIDHTKVSLHHQDSGAQVGQAVFTDANGGYSFQVENGLYKLKPQLNPFGRGEGQRPNYPLPDYASVLFAEENVSVDGATVQDVVLPMALLTGKTTDAQGAPIANTRVIISHIAELNNNDGETGYYLESQGTSLVTNALTNAQGEFTIALFTHQAMDINLVPPLSNKLVSATLVRDYVLAADKSETFVLSQPYILSGYLKDQQNRALDYTMVTVHNQSNRQLADAPVLTDANGFFQFKVAEGHYQLRPYLQASNNVNGQTVRSSYPMPDFAAVYYQPKNIHVFADTSVNVTLPMSVLSGKALDANGVIVPGVKLRIDHAFTKDSLSYYLENSGDAAGSNAMTASNGQFAFGLFTEQATDISMMPPEGSGFAITNVTHTLTQETSEDIWLIHTNFAVPKIIAGPFVKHITAHSAVVEWLTDKPGTSVVDLSNGRRYENTPLTTQHSVVLTDLTPETLYQADVHSVEKDGKQTETKRTSFTTLGIPDFRAPLILKGPFASNITHHEFTVNLCADEPVTGLVYLDDVAFELTELALCHELVMENLTPNTSYTVIAEVIDELGNGPTVSQPLVVTTLPAPDLTPPVIQLIPMVIDISATSATVIWTTDEASTSGVSYNDGVEYHVVSDPQYVIQHSMPLVDLTPETTYTLTVSSTDRHGNGPTTSLPISFTTLALPDTTAPIIIGSPLIQNITHQSVVIRWETSEPASTRLVIGMAVNALNQVEFKNGLSTSHNLPVTGLQPDTLYYFRVQTADAEGNLAMSEVMSFRTKVRGHQGNPHFMTEPQILKLTNNSLTVYWETDVNADGRLVCESAESTLEVSEDKRSKNHTLTLSGLVANTSYSCTVYSTDHHGYTESRELSGSVSTSSSNPFSVANMSVQNVTPQTNAADTTAPTTTQPPVIASYGEVAQINLETNEPSVAHVEYRLQGASTWQAAGSQAQVLNHQLVLPGLLTNSAYELRYVMADMEGNRSAAQTMNFNSGRLTDLPLPAFASQPTSSEITSNSALIAWSHTQSVMAQVSFGLSEAELLDKEANSVAKLTHNVRLLNLEPATIYYAQVKAFNLLGEQQSSEIIRFVTSATNNTNDSDQDGLPDAWEIEHDLDPRDANDATLDADTDGLSNLEEYQAQTDPNNSDSDNDGMPDGWEVDRGLNPTNPADAQLDANNDGISNLNEYLSATDKVAPVISLSASITIDARGPLTAVPTTNISATDNIDGNVAVVNTSRSHVPPGRHSINWLAEDRAGNRTIATQIVNVKPQIGLSKAQSGSEGSMVKVAVNLSGKAAVYPVRIAYTLSGTASTEDYRLSRDSSISESSTAQSGTLVIEEGQTGEMLLEILEDGISENDEFLTLTLSSPVNAVLGQNGQHRITITETNIAPRISLKAEQNSIPVTTVSAAGGPVTVTVQVVDPNGTDTHTADWSASDNVLVDTDAEPMTLTFNPASLSAGLYTVAVSVTDSGVPSKTVSRTLNLKVLASYPLLSASLDSDGDGISDLLEGYQDADLDGIPDYLDALDGSQWLQQLITPDANEMNRYLMQVEAGASLALGTLAFSDSKGGVSVSNSTFNASELFSQFGNDTGYERVGGLFDFEVRDLTPGSSVLLVIPLQTAIPANAVYRKLDPNTGWQSFVSDANNQLYSAAGEAGVCPSPGDSAYRSGLTAGHYCVMMRIQDGGANDADGEVNGTVVDPGAVSKQVAPEVIPPTTPPSSSSGGGGGGGSAFWLLWITLLLGMHRLQYAKRSR